MARKISGNGAEGSPSLCTSRARRIYGRSNKEPLLQAGEKDLRARQTALKQEKLAAREKRQKDLDEAWGSD